MKAFRNVEYTNTKGIVTLKGFEDSTFEEFNNLVKTTFTKEELDLIDTANLSYCYNEVSSIYDIDVWWLSTEEEGYETSCECHPYMQDDKRIILLRVDVCGPSDLIFESIEEFVYYLRYEFDCSTYTSW